MAWTDLNETAEAEQSADRLEISAQCDDNTHCEADLALVTHHIMVTVSPVLCTRSLQSPQFRGRSDCQTDTGEYDCPGHCRSVIILSPVCGRHQIK